MQVLIGNNNAIETFYDEGGKLAAKPLPGERITEIMFPEGMLPLVAFKTTLAALARHMKPGCKPVWIESDDKTLRRLLVEHFGLQITKSDRPEGWGGND